MSKQISDMDDFPRPQTVLSKKAQRLERMKLVKEQKKRVQRVTKRLYDVRNPPMDVAEHRETQGHVANLRHVTRLMKVRQSSSGLSTIHQMSLSMIEDIKGARLNRDSFVMDTDAEVTRQMSVPQLPSRAKSHTSNGSSSSQLHALTVKMEQLLQQNTSTLAEAQQRAAEKRKRQTLVGSVGALITKSLQSPDPNTHQPDLPFPTNEAEIIKFQLKRDLKRLETKQRLLVSSVLMLEDELKTCSGTSVIDKKKLLEKRINSIYVLMDFYKKIMGNASELVERIDEVVGGNAEEIPREKVSALMREITEVMKTGKAVDYIAGNVQANAKTGITKKELVKYQQVTMSTVVARILNAASHSFDG